MDVTGTGGSPGTARRQAGASGMSIAFDVVFGVFVIAILALAVIAIRWAVRRDRLARARQAQLREAAQPRGVEAGPPKATSPAPGPPPTERSS